MRMMRARIKAFMEECEDPEVPLLLRIGIEIRGEGPAQCRESICSRSHVTRYVDTAREFGIPTKEEAVELAAIDGAGDTRT